MACVVPLVTSWATGRPQVCESSHFTQETAVPLALYRHGRCGGLRQLGLLPTIIPGGCGMPQLPIRLPVGRARAPPGPEAGKTLSGRLYWRFQRPRGVRLCAPRRPFVAPGTLGQWSAARRASGGCGDRARPTPVWVKFTLLPTPPQGSITGPGGGPEVTGMCTRLFGETPGVLQRLRGSSLE